jgi:uracil-DNA glycosylase
MARADRFRRIYRRAHAGHPACLADEWLTHPCRDATGRITQRPIVWSRRNGPWHRHQVIFVGAAPGNAGGKGAGPLGAHATRIPFGGDLAGANLDVLLGSIGLDRNHTFLTAALNHLPAAGGGEPSLAEITAPVGDYPSSLHLLRDTVIACGPSLLVALGNVAIRALSAALGLEPGDDPPARMPTLDRIRSAGIQRNRLLAWPAELTIADDFTRDWDAAWSGPPRIHVLLITHPSAQNMSPFARTETRFHTRMLEARAALRAAASRLFGWPLPAVRPNSPTRGVYSLPEWRELIAPRHEQLDALWRSKGI